MSDESPENDGKPVRRNLPDRLQPPSGIKEEWKAAGQILGDRGYSLRWGSFWGKVIRALLKKGPIGDEELEGVIEYVRRCRLSEFHLRSAELNPYSTTEQGVTHPHPGFAQSRAESKEARAWAMRLGLLVDRQGVLFVPGGGAAEYEEPEPDPGAVPAGYIQDQVGPDGEVL